MYINFVLYWKSPSFQDPLDNQYLLRVADSQLINLISEQFLLFLRILEQFPRGYSQIILLLVVVTQLNNNHRQGLDQGQD